MFGRGKDRQYSDNHFDFVVNKKEMDAFFANYLQLSAEDRQSFIDEQNDPLAAKMMIAEDLDEFLIRYISKPHKEQVKFITSYEGVGKPLERALASFVMRYVEQPPSIRERFLLKQEPEVIAALTNLFKNELRLVRHEDKFHKARRVDASAHAMFNNTKVKTKNISGIKSVLKELKMFLESSPQPKRR